MPTATIDHWVIEIVVRQDGRIELAGKEEYGPYEDNKWGFIVSNEMAGDEVPNTVARTNFQRAVRTNFQGITVHGAENLYNWFLENRPQPTPIPNSQNSVVRRIGLGIVSPLLVSVAAGLAAGAGAQQPLMGWVLGAMLFLIFEAIVWGTRSSWDR